MHVIKIRASFSSPSSKIFPVLFYQIVRSDTDKDTKASEGALDKIRKRFFDDILCPKIIVKAIR